VTACVTGISNIEQQKETALKLIELFLINETLPLSVPVHYNWRSCYVPLIIM